MSEFNGKEIPTRDTEDDATPPDKIAILNM